MPHLHYRKRPAYQQIKLLKTLFTVYALQMTYAKYCHFTMSMSISYNIDNKLYCGLWYWYSSSIHRDGKSFRQLTTTEVNNSKDAFDCFTNTDEKIWVISQNSIFNS